MIPEHPSAINISTDRPKIKKVIRVDDKYVIVIHKNIVELLGINDTTILEQHILDSAIVMKVQKCTTVETKPPEESQTEGYHRYDEI